MFKAREYKRVESLEEAYELNQKKSNKIVGGMMWLKMSSFQKGTIIDLSGLGLNQIEETENEFQIGCMCTLRQLETNTDLNRYFDGLMREMVRHIVGVQFRNGATVGGSLYGRYGFSDVLTALLVLDTEVELYKAGRISLTEYANMPYDNDILVRIIIKKDGRKAAYVTQRRTETDFPLIAVAAAKKDDTWYTAVGARPARASLVTEADQGSAEELAEKIADQYRYGTNRVEVRNTGKHWHRSISAAWWMRSGQKKKEDCSDGDSVFFKWTICKDRDPGRYSASGSGAGTWMLQCQTWL